MVEELGRHRSGPRGSSRTATDGAARRGANLREDGQGLQAATPAWGAFRPDAVESACIALARSRLARGPLYRALRDYVSRRKPFFDVTVDGVRMRCASSGNATEWGFIFNGSWQERAGRRQIVGGLGRGDVFVDIGANCGGYSVFAGKAVGPGGRVLAVEPIPELVRRIRFNVDANGLANVTVAAVALGAETGTAVLHTDPAQLGHSTIADPRAGQEKMAVPMRTLLDLVTEQGLARIDALKIDVEGYEDRILLPFVGQAPRCLWPGRILMEVKWSRRWQSDCLGRLLDKGYRVAWRKAPDCLLVLPQGSGAKS